MKQDKELLSLDVQASLRQCQPVVTVPSFETAKAVLKAMNMFSAGNAAKKDEKGVSYWYTSVKELLDLTGSETLNHKLVGRACESFQLTKKRENDGFHVAWSQQQLDILNANIK